jgi:hypothetical protein
MLLSVYIDNTTAQMIKIIPVERGEGRGVTCDKEPVCTNSNVNDNFLCK